MICELKTWPKLPGSLVHTAILSPMGFSRLPGRRDHWGSGLRTKCHCRSPPGVGRGDAKFLQAQSTVDGLDVGLFWEMNI